YAYYCLGLIKRLPPEAEGDIRRQAADPSQSVTARSELNFALYYLREQAGRHDEAFESLAEANRLRAEAAPFNAERHRQRTSEIIEAYPPQFIDERRKHGHPETGGVYVAGMPRSGTTLTEQILA